MENIQAIIEALVLVSETPLSLEKICAVLAEVEKSQVQEALEKLIAEYEYRQSGICLQEVAGGYQFRTRVELANWVKNQLLYLRLHWKLWQLSPTGSRLLRRKLKAFVAWMSALRLGGFWIKS
jgi:predicted Zn-ribbon and HTH transcriptional regulator